MADASIAESRNGAQIIPFPSRYPVAAQALLCRRLSADLADLKPLSQHASPIDRLDRCKDLSDEVWSIIERANNKDPLPFDRLTRIELLSSGVLARLRAVQLQVRSLSESRASREAQLLRLNAPKAIGSKPVASERNNVVQLPMSASARAALTWEALALWVKSPDFPKNPPLALIAASEASA